MFVLYFLSLIFSFLSYCYFYLQFLTNIPTLKMSDRPNTSQQQMKRKLEEEKLADLEEEKMDAKKAKMMKEIAESKNTKMLEAIEAILMKYKQQQNDPTQQIPSGPCSSQQLELMPGGKSVDLFTELKEKIRAKGGGKRIPNWLLDTLEWPKRREMADSAMCTASWTFAFLCWPKLHGKVKPYKVDYPLEFWLEENNEGNYQAKLTLEDEETVIPIASVPPPPYITGFDEILIHHLDGQIMHFIECIQSKLNGISLSYDFIHTDPYLHSTEQIGQTRRLFEMLAPKATSFSHYQLTRFLRKPQSHALLENVQSIKDVIEPNEAGLNELVKWLVKSRADQKPKILEFGSLQAVMGLIFIRKILEQFHVSTQSANFIIPFVDLAQGGFILENEQTGEVLELYPNPNANAIRDDMDEEYEEPHQFLVRHPKGQEHLKADWEEQVLQQYKLPHVGIEIQGIGEFGQNFA